ncbi:MAG: dipeptidase PepE [Rhodothermales bacterium]
MTVYSSSPHRRLLLLSNSRNAGQGYLEHATDTLRDFLGSERKRVLFVPYAGVRISYDDYAANVSAAFEPAGYAVDPIHEADDAARAVDEADAIAVGGGNTFHLLRETAQRGLLARIRARVNEGVPYVGWSAGSNLACPTICTTNDMPIVEPPSFDALGLIPFQINPHFTDAHPPGHQGETRSERIAEFCVANPTMPVVGLPEGTTLRVEGDRLTLLGDAPARVFLGQQEPTEHAPGDSLQFLMAS